MLHYFRVGHSKAVINLSTIWFQKRIAHICSNYVCAFYISPYKTRRTSFLAVVRDFRFLKAATLKNTLFICVTLCVLVEDACLHIIQPWKLGQYISLNVGKSYQTTWRHVVKYNKHQFEIFLGYWTLSASCVLNVLKKKSRFGECFPIHLQAIDWTGIGKEMSTL